MNRREVVKLGIVTAAAGCIGCGGSDDGGTPDAFAGTGFEMCGADVCVDLNHPANVGLMTVNTARTLNITGDKIIIVRTSATEFAVLTRICTHNGCAVGYQAGSMEFACPCHGSRFALDGSVVRDPAIRSLKRYASTFDETTQILTIKLA